MSDKLLRGKRYLVLTTNFSSHSTSSRSLNLPVQCTWHQSRPHPEAIALVRREPKFDLAVLDVKLSGPEENSLGVAALLAEKGTPFVFLTGMRVDNVHAMEFPQAPVIEKPYDASALLEAVRRALTSIAL